MHVEQTESTPVELLLFSFNELLLHGMIESVLDKRLVFLPATAEHPQRPIGLPDAACELVEEQIRYIINVLFRVRMGMMVHKISEMNFLQEVSEMIFIMTSQSIRREIKTVAEAMNMTELPFYVALAIYAKYVATHTTPHILERDGLDIVLIA